MQNLEFLSFFSVNDVGLRTYVERRLNSRFVPFELVRVCACMIERLSMTALTADGKRQR